MSLWLSVLISYLLNWKWQFSYWYAMFFQMKRDSLYSFHDYFPFSFFSIHSVLAKENILFVSHIRCFSLKLLALAAWAFALSWSLYCTNWIKPNAHRLHQAGYHRPPHKSNSPSTQFINPSITSESQSRKKTSCGQHHSFLYIICTMHISCQF